MENFLRNVSGITRIFFDIGSKSIKISYISEIPVTRTTLQRTIEKTGKTFQRLHCIQVNYDDFPRILEYISKNANLRNTFAHYGHTTRIVAVEKMIEEKLGCVLVCHDVFECIGRGTTFLLQNIEAEAYTYSFQIDKEYEFKTLNPVTIFPYILVNIRTGVSIIRVDSENEFKRIGGSSIGGGSFLGLSNLLMSEEDLEKIMAMAEVGDPSEFDKLISDVYGDKANNLGLPGHLLAASFAKSGDFNHKTDLERLSTSSKENMASSLLRMIIYNIAQMAYLYSNREGIETVYFNGFLVRNRPIVMKTLSYAFNYWSGGKLHAFFLRHENYTSSIGAFYSSLIESDDLKYRQLANYHWKEHYNGSTALGRFVPVLPLTVGFKPQTFELDCYEYEAGPLYILANADAPPDTVDFNRDDAAREFWLNVMEETILGIRKIAIESQQNVEDQKDLVERADGFVESFKAQLRVISEHPFAYGNSNARNILELREQILRQYGFDDIYLQQKQKENEFALHELPQVLSTIDNLKNELDKTQHFEYVCRGLLAGNVFDWGAKEVVKMMNRPGGLSFSQAIESVEPRPWLFDDFEKFNSRLPTYRSILIFVDNSGCDYLLGVIPFARELLRKGKRVIICANSAPALNDLTYKEMIGLIKPLRNIDSDLDRFLKSGQLLFTQSGQGSPCMDLRRVHNHLSYTLMKNHVDLIIIEGMGRALHTNFHLEFKCDALKVAVIKTKWLADRLNGQMFSVVFKLDDGTNDRLYAGLPKLNETCDPNDIINEDIILSKM
ncbi:unnamed protein product [Caenorhabditis angaria]|uniref:4'-phosphopantetheine phosphatase n=1 Tax=Caenorhabditis angaria TaxID=860376 RepID=A0A9P1NBK5_9PELO|nr:unnamed protein product [Caenorhabditis angaria]